MSIKFIKNLINLFKGGNISEPDINYPDALIAINYQKNIVFWNSKAEAVFGYVRSEIIGKNVGLVLTDDLDKIYQSFGENKSLILSARTKHGDEIYTEITCSESETKNETFISLRDVTKNQKIIEALLLEHERSMMASQNKSKFVASLSHELRTPMHSIIGFSQALLDGLSGELSEKQKKYVTIISKNANNLLALLNRLLDLSKIESGKMEFSFKIFDCIAFINSISEIITPMVNEKKLDFTIDTTGIIKKHIYSDENHLKQVLLNLLTNAVKFTDMGSISLKVTHPELSFLEAHGIKIPAEFTDKSFLLFTASDSGIGIAEEDHMNIFDEYRQLERSVSKKYGGTGLGLAITKKVLKELGGTIWVESTLGEGAVFNFIIPIERPKTHE